MKKKIIISILVVLVLLVAAGVYYLYLMNFITMPRNWNRRPTQTVVHSDRVIPISSGETIIQWRGTNRTGTFYETGLMTSWNENEPQLLWHFDGLREGHSSPAVANGKIFVTGMTNGSGFIYVFDLNGNLLNTTEYGPEWNRSYDGARGTITPSNDKLFLISGFGVMYSFDQRTLNLIWSRNLLEEFNAPNIRWGITESPLIVGDKVIATPGGREHNVVALNKHTGELIWSSLARGDASAYCSPIFIDSQEVPLIVTMTAHHVIGLNAETGEMLWSHPHSNRHQVHPNTPLYSNGMILATSGYGHGSQMLRLINGGRGVEEVWSSRLLDNQMGGMVRVGNYVFGSGHSNRFWFCANWYTGEIMWQERGLTNGVIIANDGMLYIYTDRGDMVLARATPERFDIVGQFSITLGTDQHWAHPILYNGMLLVRRGDTLMAFNVKK